MYIYSMQIFHKFGGNLLIQSSDTFVIAVSKPAPSFEGTAVVDGKFQEVKLSDYKGKYLVFFFYPLDL